MKKLAFLILIILFSNCSKEEAEPEVVAPAEVTGEVTNYQGDSNAENQLLTEIYIDNNNATTYVYGKTGADGLPIEVTSLAYVVDNSDRVDHIVLDNSSRVSLIYTEIGGVKQNEIQVFTYPEESIVNLLAFNRDWNSMNDSLLNFTVVEIDGENYTATNLFRGGSSAIEWNTLQGWIAVGASVILAGTAVVVAPTVLAGVLAGVIFAGAASASEPPVTIVNPEAPLAPPADIEENQCANSELEVIIGVDPGYVVVAIVNGSSEFYNFYWSTGDEATGIISDIITVDGPGNYYLTVQDEEGCLAFGSVNVSDELSTLEKLIQWGPWRSPNVSIEDSQTGLDLGGFVVLSFASSSLSRTLYEYTNIETDQYTGIETISYCLDQGIDDMSFIIIESPCDTLPETMNVSSLTEQGATFFSTNFVPF